MNLTIKALCKKCAAKVRAAEKEHMRIWREKKKSESKKVGRLT